MVSSTNSVASAVALIAVTILSNGLCFFVAYKAPFATSLPEPMAMYSLISETLKSFQISQALSL